MKFWFLLFLCSCFATKALGNFVEKDPNILVDEMALELAQTHQIYAHLVAIKKSELNQIRQKLQSNTSIDEKVNLLIQKDHISAEIEKLKSDENNELSKIRFLKGLEIIKLLNEKILSLDHHYTGVYTFSEINKITNPNNYPEFAEVKSLVQNKKNRTFNLDFSLQSILGSNPIATAAQSFIEMMNIDLTSKAKKEDLRNIECILDFTLRMYGELNTIYLETTYLQESTNSIKKDIENLFKDYAQPIGYGTSLSECRNTDDWDNLKSKLNSYLKTMENSTNDIEKDKMRVDLEFSVDRLLQFINVYNDYINQGELFYKKFDTILNSYQNQSQCQSQIPIEYENLKKDVAATLQKFVIAYKPVEINGSKMKQILYGIQD